MNASVDVQSDAQGTSSAERTAAAKGGPKPQPLVGIWLLVVCAFVAAMILVGGATRLTDSGLSITEWNFAKQIAPPMSAEAWDREFGLYRETTEYQVQNRGMSLEDFQVIYLWEWGHRFLGKVIGLVFALPFLALWATGRLAGRFWPALGLFALGGLQGYIGWWMVESGLSGRLDVAPYRLATHLGMAFTILAGALALALHAFGWPRRASGVGLPVWAVVGFTGALFLQILVGALVAGSDAGRAFTDWPTIGGALIPSHYWQGVEGIAAAIENHAVTQFAHRTLGYLVAAGALVIAGFAWARGEGAARTAALTLGGLALAQAGLGIATVMHAAPLSLSLAHQALAVALWATAIVTLMAVVRGVDSARRPA